MQSSPLKLSVIFLISSTSILLQECMSVFKDNEISEQEVKKHVTYLASDELMGRGIGTEGIKKAAEYIAVEFKKAGLINPSGISGYLQPVGLETVVPPSSGIISVDSFNWKINDDFILLGGNNCNLKTDLVYGRHGMEEDYDNLNVHGKYVLLIAGDGKVSGTQEFYSLRMTKQDIALKHGALGIIEIVKTSGPWRMFTANMSGDKYTVKKVGNTGFFYAWINDEEDKLSVWAAKKTVRKAALKIEGMSRTDVAAWNVVGILEGNDPVLKNEYVAASAHYDHLGIGRPVDGDSIFNGARDNAMGTAALLMAANYLKKEGSKRSVIFLAFTAEEEGMLGSYWYVDHPLVPLKQTVFNLNTDGAGYDDTSMVSLIDPDRTTFDSLMNIAASMTGLKLGGDPAPEQQFYDRSDNVSFAEKGVPAIDLCPGVKSLSPEILKYYHQRGDEAGSLDYDYVTRYVRAFCYSLKLSADIKKRPFWMQGDVYEKAGLSLYGSRPE